MSEEPIQEWNKVRSEDEWHRVVDAVFKKPDFQKVASEMRGLHDGIKNRFTKIAMCNVSKWYFFDERTKARTGGRAFHEIVDSKEAYDDVAELAYRYFNKKLATMPFEKWIVKYVHDVGRLFHAFGIPSQFPFGEAFSLYQKYNVNNKVFDYSCGWGNRMLAALCCDLEYTGVDTNPALVEKLKEMGNDFNREVGTNLKFDIQCRGSEDFNPEWEGKFGLCLSSPPYFNVETYNGENTSTRKFPVYEDWLDGYLKPTIVNCHRYLVPGGRFVMSIKNIGRMKMYDEAMRMCREVGFELVEEPTLSVVRRTGANNTKSQGLQASNETLMVFKKPDGKKNIIGGYMIEIDRRLRFDIDMVRSEIEPNDGYRWVYYDPSGMKNRKKSDDDESDNKKENGKIILAAYEKDTHRPIVLEITDFPSTLWHRTLDKAKSTKVDSYGYPVVQETFSNCADRRKWMTAWKKREDYCSVQIVQCLDPCDEFMQQIFWKEAQEETFNKGFQRVFFLDIETEVSETSLEPFKAIDKILMITILDSKDWKFHTWSLKPCKPLSENHIVYDHYNDDEREMLKDFLRFWTKNYPDVICGWNSRWYDIPFIVRRLENVLGKNATKYISPLGDYNIIHEKSDKKDENGHWIEKDEIEWVDIKGTFQADEMVLYSDKFGVKQALDGGYGLSNVGLAEGLGSKVSYETTLRDLYLTDWQKFYEYNVRDVDLLAEIEKKCKLIPLARTVAGFGLTNYDYIYQSAPYLVPTIDIFARKHHEDMVFNSYSNNFRQKEHYEGAWVIPPTPGRYSKGTATCDFNSLYPSCMRMMNLSIETYVGRIDDGYTGEGGLDNFWMSHGGIDGIPEDTKFTFIVDRCDMKEPIKREIDVPTLKKMLDEKLIICPTNMTFFLKHEVKRGVIADWAEVFFNRRKATKKEMFKCDREADKCVDSTEKERLLTRMENLNNLQQALKICLNSIYGALGTTGCPFLHPIGLAQSVTRAGRFANSNGLKIYRRWLEEMYHVPEEYVTCASGDTDSIFFNLEAVTNDFISKYGYDGNLNNWTDEQKLQLFDHMQKFTDEYLVPNVQDVVAKAFHTTNAKVMKYGLEYMTSGGIFEAKKKYIVHKIVDEGPKVVDKFKYTGIELKRAQIPAEIKKFMKDIYFTAVLDPTFNETAMRKKIDSVYQEILKMNPNELGKWVGYNAERGMSGFLVADKGATGVSKAVNYYNQIIKKLKLDKKYELVNVGNKVQTIYVKPTNRFGIDQIGFPPKQWPEEFNDIFEIDYPKMIEKLIISPLKGFMNAMGINLHKYDPSLVASLEYSVDDI